MSAGANYTSCPKPFVPLSDYSPSGGDLSAHFCAAASSSLTCCLPCPVTDWVYGDVYNQQRPIANSVSIISLVCNVLLLFTFVLLPEEQGHRHYLSVGLTTSFVVLALAFVIPLGTKPEMCHDGITPNDMHSDLSCGWTGALLETGAMGVVVWILLRSIWTALRIAFDFRGTDIFKSISIVLGIGLPLVFLAAELPTAGVSYRLGNVCLPTGEAAFASWFGWLLAFATLSWLIQLLTILYCLWKYAVSALSREGPGTRISTGSNASTGRASGHGDAFDPSVPVTPKVLARRKRVEWRRVKKVLYFQWRTIVLSFIIVNITIYFGIVFIQSKIGVEMLKNPHALLGEDPWTACLILHEGNRTPCLDLSGGLGLSGPRAAGTFILAAIIGPLVFLLMLRGSMFTGWWQLLRNPRQLLTLLHPRRPSIGSQDFVLGGGKSPKHLSLGKALESDEPQVPLAGDEEAAVHTEVAKGGSGSGSGEGKVGGASVESEIVAAREEGEGLGMEGGKAAKKDLRVLV